MNKKEAKLIKVLAELNPNNQPDLTEEQEEVVKRALTPEDFFLDDVLKLFTRRN